MSARPTNAQAPTTRVTKSRSTKAKVDQTEFTDAGKQYKQARQRMEEIQQRIDTGNARPGDMQAYSQANSRVSELWPSLTHRDVAEGVVKTPREVDPEVYDSLVKELTNHVAFTKKSSAWKTATVDVADMDKVDHGIPADPEGGQIRAVTLAGQHVVLGSHLVGSGHKDRSNQRNLEFNHGFASINNLGPDDVGGHRATLAHEVGHVFHHAGFRSTQIPGTSGEHMSGYGNTHHMEGAAEAYAAAYARAHGHAYSNDQLADVGDQIAARVRKIRW